MKRDRAVTLADIAEHGGVALSTVSYVLSGKRRISEPVRQRVLQAIEELDYRPNSNARALASGATHALGLLLPSPHHRERTEHHTFVAGAAQATSASEYSLVLSTAAMRPSRVAQLVDERRVDGVILMEIDLRDRRVEHLRKQGYAFSVIGYPEDTEGVSYVDIDIVAGVVAAVEHLVELGHRRVALFNEAPRGRATRYAIACRSRVAFAEACSRLGVEAIEVEVPREAAETYGAARRTMSELQPTAAIALGTSSPAVIDAARDAQLRVPDDFSIVGFMVHELAEILRLTNVDFPAFDMGRIGAEMLIGRLAGGDIAATRRLLHPPLTVRHSTGPVRRKPRNSRAKLPAD